MAKSKGFFGKRVGSVGDLTFTVLNGKQVTKQKISHTSNPRSRAQAERRMLLLPAQLFLRAFGNILDHSFENVRYGRLSKQHFLKLALASGNVTFPIVRNSTVLYPQEYIVSEGSLPAINATIADGAISIATVAAGATLAEWLEANAAFEKGDQISVVAVVQDAQGNHFPLVDRIVVNDETFVTGAMESGHFAVDFAQQKIDLSNQGVTMLGAAVIHSRQGEKKWLRSTETMYAPAPENYTVLYNRAVLTYRSKDGLLTSNLYLNQSDTQEVIDEEGAEGEDGD